MSAAVSRAGRSCQAISRVSVVPRRRRGLEIALQRGSALLVTLPANRRRLTSTSAGRAASAEGTGKATGRVLAPVGAGPRPGKSAYTAVGAASIEPASCSSRGGASKNSTSIATIFMPRRLEPSGPSYDVGSRRARTPTRRPLRRCFAQVSARGPHTVTSKKSAVGSESDFAVLRTARPSVRTGRSPELVEAVRSSGSRVTLPTRVAELVGVGNAMLFGSCVLSGWCD